MVVWVLAAAAACAFGSAGCWVAECFRFASGQAPKGLRRARTVLAALFGVLWVVWDILRNMQGVF